MKYIGYVAVAQGLICFFVSLLVIIWVETEPDNFRQIIGTSAVLLLFFGPLAIFFEK